MATTYYNDLQKLYVAYFNRPGDTSGLANYETQLEAAGTDAKAIAAVMARISAEFSNSQEYKANFTGKTNAEIVDTVYMNLFGRPADAGGKAFYADNLTAGKLTVAAVVTEVAKGAQGSDLTAYNNKVTAAAAFSAALTTSDSYNTQPAATAAKAFLSGVTDNASLATAIDPVMLRVAIAKVNVAANDFSLQTGLSALTAAQTAHTNFLDAFDGKLDGKVTKTDADVAAAVAPKATAVATIVDANVAAGEAGLYATTTNAAIKAAVLAEAQANLAGTLSADQKSLATTNTKIDATVGLRDAINALTAANSALDTATKTQTAAHTDVLVKIAAYNVTATTAIVAPAAGATNTYDAAVAAAVAAGVITKSATTGALSLATGVTEAKNPGATALLASLNAEKAADDAATSAASAQVSAQGNVDFLDLTTAAQTDIKDIAAAMTLTKLPAGALPTQSQIAAESAGLLAVKTATAKVVTDAGTGATQAQKDAAAAADAAYSKFTGLVSKLAGDDNANPLYKSMTDLTAKISDDQKAIDGLATALSDLAKAQTSVAQLDAVNGQLKAAQDAFTSKGLMQPVMLDTITAATATAGADIFVAGSKSATIGGFGQIGADSLYIGNKFTSLGTDLSKGNDAVLEAFLTKDATGNVVISVETKAFASSEAAPAADLVQITLTGVTDVTKVHLNNGIITVS